LKLGIVRDERTTRVGANVATGVSTNGSAVILDLSGGRVVRATAVYDGRTVVHRGRAGVNVVTERGGSVVRGVFRGTSVNPLGTRIVRVIIVLERTSVNNCGAGIVVDIVDSGVTIIRGSGIRVKTVRDTFSAEVRRLICSNELIHNAGIVVCGVGSGVTGIVVCGVGRSGIVSCGVGSGVTGITVNTVIDSSMLVGTGITAFGVGIGVTGIVPYGVGSGVTGITAFGVGFGVTGITVVI